MTEVGPEVGHERLRVTLAGFEQRFVVDPEEGIAHPEAGTVQELDSADRAPGAIPRGSRTAVRPLPTTPADRGAGRRRFEVSVDGWLFEVGVESEARALLRERTRQARDVAGTARDLVISAQIPGRVVRLWVAEGDTVEAGQRLLAVEAMKMENEVRATRSGTVASVRVAVGSSVELGDELLTVR